MIDPAVCCPRWSNSGPQWPFSQESHLLITITKSFSLPPLFASQRYKRLGIYGIPKNRNILLSPRGSGFRQRSHAGKNKPVVAY